MPGGVVVITNRDRDKLANAIEAAENLKRWLEEIDWTSEAAHTDDLILSLIRTLKRAELDACDDALQQKTV